MNFEKLENTRLYRVDSSTGRWYYDPDTPDTLYPSVTTVIGGAMPTPYALLELRGNLGNDGYHQYMNIKADYGTLLHKAFSQYIESGHYDFRDAEIEWDHIQALIRDALPQVKAAVRKHTKMQVFKKYFASVAHFCKLHDVKPLLIEQVVKYDDGDIRYAGAADLVCTMTIAERGYHGERYKSGAKKGLPKETLANVTVTALIDLKSGTWGFSDQHEIQLHAYKLAVEQMYPYIKIDRVYNLSPRDTRGARLGFNLTDQTQSRYANKILDLAALYEVVMPQNRVVIGDTIDDDPQGAVQEVPILEFIKNKIGE